MYLNINTSYKKKMKKKLLGIFLAVEAIVCVILALLWKGQQDINTFKAIEKPFELLGDGLRQLSLSNATGNIIALIIYIVVCLIPVIIAAIRLIKKKAKIEELLLVLLSVLMFWGIYVFINPSTVLGLKGEALIASMYNIEIVTTILSTLVLYIVVRIVRTFDHMKEAKLVRVLKISCAVVMMLIVYAICFDGVSTLIAYISEAISKNIYVTNTIVVLTIRFIVEQVPNICMFIIVARLMDVTGVLRQGFINQELLEKVNILSKLCKKSVVIIMVSIMGMNLLQLCVNGYISMADFNVTVPVLEILALLVLLVITKVIAESYKLKEVNDLFI